MTEERRKNPRANVGVPVEIHVDGNAAPLHCATSDLSFGGCYVESRYPFPAGTRLELKLQVADTLLIEAKVVTCDPQFGNGIAFVKMLPEDSDKLADFCASASPPADGDSGNKP
jgi:PilZ domain